MALKTKRRPQLLSSSRPNKCKPPPSLSSKSTRATIGTHHVLQKQLSCALRQGDNHKADQLRARIRDVGGIRKYQQASIQGQSAQRGGDTSKVLMEWLSEYLNASTADDGQARKLKLLEVGALRTDNACARSGLFNMERIDLHSQHPNIKEQDFMLRPVPKDVDLDKEGFDIVSLSLVVNFVGDAAGRGDMLRRASSFLRPSNAERFGFCPAVFLVLPAPCVENSRYLNDNRLEEIMNGLGYTKIRSKMSGKLAYYLWIYQGTADNTFRLSKKEVRPGRGRNNFAIVLS